MVRRFACGSMLGGLARWRLFRKMLPGPDEPTYPRTFALLILDEAHNCAPS